MKKFISLSLTIILALAMAVPAFAVEADPYAELRDVFDSSYEFDAAHWVFNSNGDLVYLAGDEVDSTPLEIRPQPFALNGTQYLFTMNISAMYNDLHTTGAKSFTKASLENDYVRAVGVIESDVNDLAVVGLCEYDDSYVPCNWSLTQVNCNEYFSISWEASGLSPHYYYYGWAQSAYNSNTYPYSGYIEYYDSARP